MLGVVVGEVVFGKKVGNWVMFWGVIGGIVFDFDVFVNMVIDEISVLVFYWVIMYFFVFVVLVFIILGGLVYYIYKR